MICVSSQDTDVLVGLMDVVATGQLEGGTTAIFQTGKALNRKEINVNEMVRTII